MKRDCYITVQAWMVSELGLHGNELLAYALIYGFSQDEESCYKGSVKYLQEWLDISDRTAKALLAGLVEKGLLQKWQEIKNGRSVNRYSVVSSAPAQEDADAEGLNSMGEEVSPDGGRNYPYTGEKTSPDPGKNFTPQGEKISPRPIKGKLKGNIQGNLPTGAGAREPAEYGQPADVFIAFANGNAALLESLRGFDEFRRKGKAAKSWSGVAADRVCKKLARLAADAGAERPTGYMIACLDQSIENGWTTVYPVKDYIERPAQAKVHAVGGQDNPRTLTAEMDICDFL